MKKSLICTGLCLMGLTLGMNSAWADDPPLGRPERITKALAAQKELKLNIQRLQAKRSEIERWDNVAQEKFRKAFGGTDEKVRQKVIQRIDQLIQESTRTLASLAEAIRFDFYISMNKQ